MSDPEMTNVARVPVARFQGIACPVSAPPWAGASGCLKGAVWRALRSGAMRASPVEPEEGIEAHAARIVFLMRHGWADPIEFDVGVPHCSGWRPTWPIVDGNHRLAAVILGGHPFIEVAYYGCLDTARDELGIAA